MLVTFHNGFMFLLGAAVSSTYAYTYTFTHIYIHLYIHIYICKYICIYIHTCMYIYTCMYLCVCVCVCVWEEEEGEERRGEWWWGGSVGGLVGMCWCVCVCCGMVFVGWLGRGNTALHCTHLVLTHMLKSEHFPFCFPLHFFILC